MKQPSENGPNDHPAQLGRDSKMKIGGELEGETNVEDRDQTSGGSRFSDPKYLTDFTYDPDAIQRLNQVKSETANRLVGYSFRKSIVLTAEDCLAPLAQTDGDVVLRVIDAPGANWIWWRGKPLETHHYGRVAALPHYQDHEVIHRRNAHPDHLQDYLLDGHPIIPVHRSNCPASIQAVIEDNPAEGESQ